MSVFPRPFVVPDKDLDRLYGWVLAADRKGCRDWRGVPTHNGYGRFSFAEEDGTIRYVRAHNAIWVVERGPFPAERQPDHLCLRPICTNPEHIEWVTQAENRRRQQRFILAHGSSDALPPREPRAPRVPKEKKPRVRPQAKRIVKTVVQW